MELHRRPWPPMRHPGLCGLRATTWILFFLSLLIVLPLTPKKGSDSEPVMMTNDTASANHTLRPRRVRETANDFVASLSESWMDHPSPPHPYATNLWWRLTNHTAKKSEFRTVTCAHSSHTAPLERTCGRTKITTHRPSWLWWLWQQLCMTTTKL